MGGKPQQLSQILSKDANGDYYILRCDLKNMEKCVKTADGLLSYATDNYPNQISYSDGGKGLEPLGLGFAHYTPIRYIGLTPSDTLVTPQVQKVRLTLASIYKANQYYQEKAYQIMNGYPVQSQFLKPSTLYANASLLYDIAKSNINILKPAQDADAGALGCFDYPDQCEMVAKSLQTSIKPITDSNLTFLEEIQYKYLIVPSNIPPGSTLTSYFYPLGNSQYAPSIAIYNTLVKQWPGFDCSVSFSAQVNSGVEKYHLGLSERDRINNRVGGEDYYFNGSSSNNGLSYHGDAYTIDKIGH